MQSWIIKNSENGADRTHFTDDMYDAVIYGTREFNI